jgi:hypothetical protein
MIDFLKINLRRSDHGISGHKAWLFPPLGAPVKPYFVKRQMKAGDLPSVACVAGSVVTEATAKPEEKRFDGSAKTGADQTKIWVNPTTEPKVCAQFKRQMPEPRYNLHKRLDWGS